MNFTPLLFYNVTLYVAAKSGTSNAHYFLYRTINSTYSFSRLSGGTTSEWRVQQVPGNSCTYCLYFQTADYKDSCSPTFSNRSCVIIRLTSPQVFHYTIKSSLSLSFLSDTTRDNASARTFSVVLMYVAAKSTLAYFSKSMMRWTSNRNDTHFEYHFYRMYITAWLSVNNSTFFPRKLTAIRSNTNLTHFNSRKDICYCASYSPHRPPYVRPARWAPHPDSEASVNSNYLSYYSYIWHVKYSLGNFWKNDFKSFIA